MPEWLIIAVVVLLMLRVVRGGCGWAGISGRRTIGCGTTRRFARRAEHPLEQRVGRRTFSAERTTAGLAAGRVFSERADRPSGGEPGARVAPRPESAEDRLRRDFVEGKLTLEEYEERLWQELRPR